MDIFNVQCPACGREYYADMLLYSLPVELHCPYCGLFFCREDSPRVVIGSTGASTVARVAGSLDPQAIYRPPDQED